MPTPLPSQVSQRTPRRTHPQTLQPMRAVSPVRPMQRYGVVAPALLAIALGALLAGCGGVGADSTASGTATPNTSAPTSTAGPIVIASDHSTYSPTDALHITITNQLSAAIYAFDTQASCSVLSLQVSQGGQWVPADVARCPLGRAAHPVAIAPGVAYTATITAGTKGLPSANDYFTPGQYRLVLSYYTASPTTGGASNPTHTYSATLTVVGPVPTPTPVGTTRPEGTVGASGGTIIPGGPIISTPSK